MRKSTLLRLPALLFFSSVILFSPAVIHAQTAPVIIKYLYGDQTIVEEFPLEFMVAASGTNLVYSASGLPAGATFTQMSAAESFDPYPVAYKFAWKPAVGQTGTFPITFTVASGTAKSQVTVTLTVKPNCLLHSLCPAGYVCRGDGLTVPKVTREYGSDAYTGSDPLGGGVGYSKIVDPSTAKVVVSTAAQLAEALKPANAPSGTVIYVADNAVIDMSAYPNTVIPAGVTLASGRGRNGSLGAMISSKVNKGAMFITGGANIRVTGLRLRGPETFGRRDQMNWLGEQSPSRYYEIPWTRGLWCTYSNITVDNCEWFGWTHGAILFNVKSYNNHVHHNYIHHNMRNGLGYGVSVYQDSSVLIEANVFDWNRHSIAGASGASTYPGASYEARYNFVMGNSIQHYFDCHGGNDSGDATIPAGNVLNIHHNTFFVGPYTTVDTALGIRGVPRTSCTVTKNWATHDPARYTGKWVYYQHVTNLGLTPYVKMTVTDNWQGTTPPPVTSGSTNRPPVISFPLTSTVNENALLSFTVSATDPDGDALTYSATGLPAGASFNPTTRVFSWTPTYSQAGAYTVTFTAVDSKMSSASGEAKITVVDVNRAPVLAAIGSKTVTQGQSLSFTVTASDPDGNSLTYSATNLPAGAVFTPATRVFSWTPTVAGTFSAVRFSVTDGKLTDSEDITITVTPAAVNRSPVITVPPNATANENLLLNFTVSATDPDGDAIVYGAIGLPSGASFSASTGVFTWTPSYSQAGTYTVTFSASDGKGGSSSGNTIITVANVNRAPVLSSIGAKTVEQGKALGFTISATDPDGDALTYRAANLPAGAVFDPTTRVFSWTPSAVGIFSGITFAVTDGALTDSESITITVSTVVIPKPVAPTSLTGMVSTTASGAVVILNWKDNSTNETGFYVESSRDGTSYTRVATIGANIATAQIPVTQKLYFRVQAHNASGVSAYSNVVTVNPRKGGAKRR